MPRDSNGTYQLPAGTLATTGTTIEVSQHNPAFLDVGQALTNSLDRDGRGGMLGDLNMNGNRISNVAAGVLPNDLATVGQASGSIPIGVIFDYAGITEPANYLFCDGRAVSRNTYSSLFALIGTRYGAGNGSTTFNLPDFRGAVAVGLSNMGGTERNNMSGYNASTMGQYFGASQITLNINQMPSHGHGVSISSSGSHTHIVNLSRGDENWSQGSGNVPLTQGANNPQTTTSGGEHTHAGSATNNGGGQAHGNVQPSLIVTKIIRVS